MLYPRKKALYYFFSNKSWIDARRKGKERGAINLSHATVHAQTPGPLGVSVAEYAGTVYPLRVESPADYAKWVAVLQACINAPEEQSDLDLVAALEAAWSGHAPPPPGSSGDGVDGGGGASPPLPPTPWTRKLSDQVFTLMDTDGTGSLDFYEVGRSAHSVHPFARPSPRASSHDAWDPVVAGVTRVHSYIPRTRPIPAVASLHLWCFRVAGSLVRCCTGAERVLNGCFERVLHGAQISDHMKMLRHQGLAKSVTAAGFWATADADGDKSVDRQVLVCAARPGRSHAAFSIARRPSLPHQERTRFLLVFRLRLFEQTFTRLRAL